jgi:hypothetical protein
MSPVDEKVGWMTPRWQQIDRRWVFLLMAIAVGIPVVWPQVYPEEPTRETKLAFQAVEELPPGSRVMLAMDYDNASAAELDPMTVAIARHCLLKQHKLYLVTLWPTGKPLLDQLVRNQIEQEFSQLGYRNREDYVNLGYQPGYEVAIKLMATDLRRQIDKDSDGVNINDIPLLNGVSAVRDLDLLVNISAGYPGAKEWIQFAGTQGALRLIVGCTGVQAPLMYPYVPDQIVGLLAAIKGAAEYETALGRQYAQYADPMKHAARQRMGPQLWAHLLMIGLMIAGNVLHWTSRPSGRAR